jgi:signal transduction histidine kinase
MRGIMTPEEPNPERAKTDQSLRNERNDADSAVVELRIAEQVADRLVDRARTKADAVLDHARDKADSKLSAADSTRAGIHTGIASERAQEDETLLRERAAADARVRRERERHAETLEKQLLRKRASTDRYLLTERYRSDSAIATRDDFLGMVSHDLRARLESINLRALVLSEEASDNDEGRRTTEAMKRMQRDVASMSAIIEDLVDIVSIDAGRLAIRMENGDAGALLTEAADAFAVAAAEKSISLSIEVTDEPLQACFDHQRMGQVLANCVSNAVKFTPWGGRIVLRGRRDGDAVRLSVCDSGPGIPDALLEAVFERFWQVEANDQRGMGLGLYISRCIVTGHGGRIWFEKASDRGSIIHCTIPCSASAGSDSPPHG